MKVVPGLFTDGLETLIEEIDGFGSDTNLPEQEGFDGESFLPDLDVEPVVKVITGPDDEVVVDPNVGGGGPEAAESAASADGEGAPSAAESGSGICGSTYTVVGGDTLMKISRHCYSGNADRWSDIASLNGLVSPYTLSIGQTLSLP
ncbi:LysM peptidoglycan-binding domain-containing protein [Patescibacteria group bacterium]